MNLTKIVLLSAIFGLLIYDAFVGTLGVPTESQVLRDWALQSVTLPFTAGFLLGHWFFPRKEVDYSAWVFAAIFLLAFGAWDIYWFYNNLPGTMPNVWYRYPGWYALLGVPVGTYLWGQRE